MANNRVALHVDGKVFTGWQSVEVTRSIEHMAGDFSLGVVLPGNSVPDSLRPGVSLVLDIDGKTVITGWVDTVKQRISARDLSISLSGRDKTGDLVDCSAVYKGGQWHNRTLQQIAQDLCAPFGVRVRWDVNDATAAKPFATFTLELSETVGDALVRAARHRGVLVTSNEQGDVVFTQARAQRTDTLTLGENLLSCDYSNDWRDRFSEYNVKGHSGGGGKNGDGLTAALIAAPKGSALDNRITRYRPKIILADHKVDATTARQRALREERRALAKSVRFSATVRGWFRQNGDPWQPNLLTQISAERVGLTSGQLLVTTVKMTLDNQEGAVTQLTLAPREGFLVPAEPDGSGNGDDSLDVKIKQYYREHKDELDG
ncbi:phage tail protein [Salmonella enterica subsp. enterica]|nr:phage tail protein [Salmonella enterica subsp. enterica]EDR6724127.1 phage tail protein [Salmonella enterica subsp. enterica]EDR7291865.1 phage tail protein [Salmonella enterica subsp. enterica serovar Pomona]EKJ6509531.1 phage tail protein [Salmonella enterica]